jgi:hypothetical protein
LPRCIRLFGRGRRQSSFCDSDFGCCDLAHCGNGYRLAKRQRKPIT